MSTLRGRKRFLAFGVYLVPPMILLCLTLPALEQGAFRVDTGRYAAVALDAWRRGAPLDLRVGEWPYLNKPPLAFWIHGLVLWALGPHLWVARLPSIAAAAGAVVATVGFTRELSTRRAALLAGCVLALTYEFFRRAREFSLDLWMVFFLMLAAWAIAAGVRRRRGGLIVLGGVAVGLALLTKPIVGLLAFPALAIGAWWTRKANADAGASAPKMRRAAAPWAASVAVALAIALAWHLAMYAAHGEEFLRQYFGAEIADRAAGRNVQDPRPWARPPWFYLVQMAETYWPWLLFVVLAVVTMARGVRLTRRGLAERMALSWFLVWLLAISAFPDRADRYAVVLWPFGAVLASLWLVRRPWRWLRPVVRVLPQAALAVAAVAAVGIELSGARVQRPADPQWPALFSALEALGDPPVHLAGYDTETASLLYLVRGRWPTQTRTRWGEPLHTPRRGEYVVYHTRSGLSPGPGEVVELHVREVTLSRLEGDAWRPMEGATPGPDAPAGALVPRVRLSTPSPSH